MTYDSATCKTRHRKKRSSFRSRDPTSGAIRDDSTDNPVSIRPTRTQTRQHRFQEASDVAVSKHVPSTVRRAPSMTPHFLLHHHNCMIPSNDCKSMTKALSILSLVLGGLGLSVLGYQASNNNGVFSRRNILATAASVAATTLVATPRSVLAAADHEDPLVSVYFGVGCFWHIQHEFIEGERQILKRGDHQLTSATGYAGGTETGDEGRVCYHNFQRLADYGKLGHGEVVGMAIPQSKIGDFSDLYFSLFNPKTKDRVDPQDRGGEYRSLIGLPGGTKHPSYPDVETAAGKYGFNLALGKGNDPDTLGKALVYVYDTKRFPFYQAEVYHQYHDDFQSPPYGKAYNKLADLALEDGRIKGTGCPDRV